MRKLIAAAALMAVTSVSAEELKFGDVNYFLKQGQFNVAADVNQTFYRRTYDGTTLLTRAFNLETNYAYALTDKLNAFVGLTYSYNNKTRNKTVGANADIYSDGLANPAFGLNYRVLNQNDSRYNFDLGLVARVGIEDAEVGSSVGQDDADGNFANGRDSLELNARIGRKWNEANEWQLAAGAIYHNEGETTFKGVAGAPDEDVDLDSSLDYFARATYQYRPVNEFMVLLGVQGTYISDANSDVKGGGKIKEDARVDVDLRFTAKYLITSTFIAKFNYVANRLGEYDVDDQGAKNSVSRRTGQQFGLGVDFLF